MREYKCKSCGNKRVGTEMEIEEKVSAKGKVTKTRYCKGDCWDNHLKDLEFKRVEKEERDLLFDTIMKVHGMQSLPKQIFPFLEDIRNGVITQDQRKYKQKEGYTYRVIAETYLYVEDSIDWSKKTIPFTDDYNELKYGLAIVSKNLNKVRERILERERAKQIVENTKNDFSSDGLEDDKKTKKKKSTNISKFL